MLDSLKLISTLAIVGRQPETAMAAKPKSSYI
jgi:hypothetical protein